MEKIPKCRILLEKNIVNLDKILNYLFTLTMDFSFKFFTIANFTGIPKHLQK